MVFHLAQTVRLCCVFGAIMRHRFCCGLGADAAIRDRCEYKDEQLLAHLALVTQQMHPDSFDVQAISNLANAYVKLEADPEVTKCLLEFISVVAQCIEVSSGPYLKEACDLSPGK